MFFSYFRINMVHVIFDGSLLKLNVGRQTGSGSSSFSFFEGLPPKFQRGHGYHLQQGHGVGNIFRSIWRFLRPLGSTLAPYAKDIGKAMAQEGIQVGADTLSKIAQGDSPKQALVENIAHGTKRLVDRAVSNIQQRQQKGSGCRARPSKRRVTSANTTHVILKPGDIVQSSSILGRKKQPVNKKKRKDALGYY
jgi:hypothetical protein